MCSLTKRVLSVVLISTPFLGCAGQDVQYPDQLKASKGVLCLRVRNDSASWLGLAFSGPQPTTLMTSTDKGRSWRRIDGNWSEFLFLDSRRGFLARDTALYETLDGGTEIVTSLHEFPDVIEGVSVVGSRLMVSTSQALFASSDGGRHWDRVEYAPASHATGPQAVAGDDTHLAVATRAGRVFTYFPGESWREWVVGPTLDLAYFDGVFHALTSMATVAVLDGKSVGQHALEPSYWWGLKFARVGDRLFFPTPRGLFEIVNGKPQPILASRRHGVSEAFSPLIAMAGEDELLEVLFQENRVDLKSIRLSSLKVEDLEGI